jgi:hypothetical protein
MVSFRPPVNARDLRLVMASHTARQHDVYAVAYRTTFGETRVINWLTYSEAVRRGANLRARGYKVAIGPMDIA